MLYDQLAATLDSYFRINERCVYFLDVKFSPPLMTSPPVTGIFFVPVNLSDLTKKFLYFPLESQFLALPLRNYKNRGKRSWPEVGEIQQI